MLLAANGHLPDALARENTQRFAASIHARISRACGRKYEDHWYPALDNEGGNCMTTEGYTNLTCSGRQAVASPLEIPNLAIIDVRAAATYARADTGCGAFRFSLALAERYQPQNPWPRSCVIEHLFEPSGRHLDKP